MLERKTDRYLRMTSHGKSDHALGGDSYHGFGARSNRSFGGNLSRHNTSGAFSSLSESAAKKDTSCRAVARGHKFTNLDEAHQAITKPSSSSPSGLESSSELRDSFFINLDPSDPDFAVSEHEMSLEDELRKTQYHHPSAASTTKHVTDPRSSKNAQAITPAEDQKHRNGKNQATRPADLPSANQEVSSSAAGGSQSEATGNTVENIYDQYLPSIDSRASSSSGFNPALSKGFDKAAGAHCSSSTSGFNTALFRGPESELDPPVSPSSSGFNTEYMKEHHVDAVARNVSSSSGFNTALLDGSKESGGPVAEDERDDASTPGPRDGAVGRASFRFPESLEPPDLRPSAEDVDPGKKRYHLYLSPGTAPNMPLPELPLEYSVAGRSRAASCTAKDFANRETHRAADTADFEPPFDAADDQCRQEQLVSVHENTPQSADGDLPGNFVPMTGSILPSRDIATARDSLCSHGGLSGAGLSTGMLSAGLSTGMLSTDSDDDPFRYDRASFTHTIFVEPEREREVSVALRRISQGTASIFTGGGTPERNARPGSLPPPVPAVPSGTAHHPRYSENLLSKNPSYAIQTLVEEHPFELEYESSHRDTIGTMSDAHLLYSKQLEGCYGGGIGSEADDEWVTVAETRGFGDSNRAMNSGNTTRFRPFNLATGPAHSRADTISIQLADSEYLRPEQKIIQHPVAAQRDINVHLHLRTTKDTGVPVLLPTQNSSRVNGFAVDSCRMVSSSMRGEGSNSVSHTARIANRIAAPFRAASFGRQIDERDAYQDLDKRKKYAFQESMWADAEDSSGFFGMRQPEAEPRPKRSHREPTATSEISSNQRHADGDYTFAQLDGSIGPATSNQFSFPLLPLSEAARRQAMRRASGEDDQTFVSSTRDRQNSGESGKTMTTQKTSPMLPEECIRKPNKAHLLSARAKDVPSKSRVPRPL